jgi:hypothetical protein
VRESETVRDTGFLPVVPVKVTYPDHVGERNNTQQNILMYMQVNSTGESFNNSDEVFLRYTSILPPYTGLVILDDGLENYEQANLRIYMLCGDNL